MTEKAAKLIELLFEKGILAQEDLVGIDFLREEILEKNKILEKIETEADLLILNKEYLEAISQPGPLIDWYEIDSYKVEAEKERDDKLYQNQLNFFRESTLTLKQQFNEEELQPNEGRQLKEQKQRLSSLEMSLDADSPGAIQSGLSLNFESDNLTLISGSDGLCNKPGADNDPGGDFSGDLSLSLQGSKEQIAAPLSVVTVVLSFENSPKKYQVSDFAKIFKSRFRFLEKILQNRQELHPLAAISRVIHKKEKEEIAVIGMVKDRGETKTGNIILTLEDLTGEIKILVSKNKKDLLAEAKDLVVDEVIGVKGVSADKLLFAEKIIWPDVPGNNELKKSEAEEYAVFLSDIHVGSTLFMKEEFNRFLNWICGEAGNELQREIAQKVRYLFIAGDVVDGIGVYPSQEEELEIKDINQQYEEFSRLIKKVPARISIIICPGNHDAVQLAEPQPAFHQRFSSGLFSVPNITLVTNPAVVNIGRTPTFGGFDVLMYHGFSFDYYVTNVESIRSSGGYRRSDLIMKFLLRRRHLAPSFKSTPYFPSHDEDPLLIKKVPDFLITGHIHYCSVANYKATTMISGSCWQAKTSFQEKLGHEPEPARVPVVNLKTREIKILRFG